MTKEHTLPPKKNCILGYIL